MNWKRYLIEGENIRIEDIYMYNMNEIGFAIETVQDSYIIVNKVLKISGSFWPIGVDKCNGVYLYQRRINCSIYNSQGEKVISLLDSEVDITIELTFLLSV
jgi:hypothetical protein